MDDSLRELLLLNRKRDENTARSTRVKLYFKGQSPGCVHSITYKYIAQILLKPLSYMTEFKMLYVVCYI